MAQKVFELRTPESKSGSRYIESFHINLPVEKIDVYKWVRGMTDDDYTSYSTAHKAMGSFIKDNVFYMKNVEHIGIETLVQHYELKYHAANHVQFYSPKSRAYIMRWFPATVGVPWELYLQPVSAKSSRLICMIGVDFPGFALKMASWFSSFGGLFLRNHLNQEGKAFVLDIEDKFSKRSFARLQSKNRSKTFNRFRQPVLRGHRPCRLSIALITKHVPCRPKRNGKITIHYDA
jgi:hypothetical protein